MMEASQASALALSVGDVKAVRWTGSVVKRKSQTHFSQQRLRMWRSIGKVIGDAATCVGTEVGIEAKKAGSSGCAGRGLGILTLNLLLRSGLGWREHG